MVGKYKVLLSSQACKDKLKLERSGLSKKAKELIDIISENPYQTPPRYEKLVGRLNGKLSRRINIQHRLVYTVYEEEKTIVVASMWSHYETL